MSKFDDIRPYNDSEVRPVLDRILTNPELIQAVSSLRFPRLGKLLPWLINPIVSRVLKSQLAGVNSVYDLQMIVAKYMRKMITQRVSELTVSGIDKLEPGKSYVFVSNHRDIAMDPAFVNLVLNDNGLDTVRIAIGDNLLTKDYVSDLMRLNKSFIVNRSATAPREKLKAAKHLSAFIHHSVNEESSNIWIAQREGRAKDGLDKTNTAIVSMLALNRPKPQPFAEYVRELNIVPVSISYEWDPCDAAKAQELYAHQEHGEYEKDEHEDIASIAAGIAGEKGHVHVAFGDVLKADFENADQVAAEIDRQVWDNYVLHPSNHLAYKKLHAKKSTYPVSQKGEDFVAADYAVEEKLFEERLAHIPPAQRDIFLAAYANPIVSKELAEQDAQVEQ
ncbi:1-acyl-sn-glycerol-3-phosphate acyltransferase [Maricurvus nonylphenolicus]|uniref:1-acyl-sn-glycerol-3-phosphate acyltransferase n=1 Tax=Maricurvus nonylphenolicus TaxID=1008307 RepID=UPI0036F34358